MADLNSMAQDALRAFQQGQWDTSAELSWSVLQLQPQRADMWTLHGMALRRLGRLDESEQAYRKAVEADFAYADAHYNLGNLLRDSGRTREAAMHYRLAIARRPDWLDAFIALGDVLNTLGESEQARHVSQYAIGLDPSRPENYNNLGNALDAAGDAQAALDAYAGALRVAPDHLAAANNRALLLARLDRKTDAADALRALLAHHPGHLAGWIKLGELAKQLGEYPEAVVCYRRALELQPGMAELENNLGVIYSSQNNWAAAEGAYRRALQLGATHAQVYLNLGNACHALRRYGEALEAYRAGLAREPGNVALLTELIHVQQKVCDWEGFNGLRERLLPPALAWRGEGAPPSPFAFLCMPFEVTPAEQQIMAGRYADYVRSAAGAPFVHAPARAKDKLKIAYVSADFYNHATAHLMLGLFGRHDRSRFEISAYSMGPDDGSEYRRRIRDECDHFIDIRELSDAATATRMRDDGVDIAVDLKGYTGDARPGIFARRPAPVQVAYLGYPGTMGADFMDYVIADRVVIPQAHIPYYNERPVFMPHSYQVNDIGQAIAAETPTRRECGLPEQGFVFCCFNSPYKIEPRMFSVWMDLLKAVPGSVLWLFAAQQAAADNLRRAAERHGVQEDRLVFASPQPKDKHLARHRHADLFLDTLYYNAHTTASDALWAGVPLITCPGDTFASRVAASLLHAAGLPELIVDDLDRYAALAVELAQAPQKLQGLKHALSERRMSCPLFDTGRFARDLERAYAAMWRNHVAGSRPQAIYLD